jgi:phosphatidylglycerol---prolipoprotein diacylglyceryl transferase
MFPVAFRLGPVAVYTYPLVMLAALTACWYLGRRLAPRLHIPGWAITDLVLAAAVGGLVGGRAWYVATFPSLYASGWWRVFELQNGGLVFYGAVAGGALGVVAVASIEHLPLRGVADIAALALPLGSAIGRLGCLSAGCCGGTGLRVGSVVVAPQVADMLAQSVLFCVMLMLASRIPFGRGTLFWCWLALYPVVRFGIEYLRADPRVAFGLTQAQLVSVPLAVAGVAGVVWTMQKGGAR